MGKEVRSAVKSKVVLLDRMKKVSAFVGIVLTVGEQVSEVMLHYRMLSVKLTCHS